jgi:glycerophosphoryl diester phosphodiesterase
MAAFRRAVRDGADMIELDVRMTKDFHVVVHHDRNVSRTTGKRGFIWDLTLQQIRMLDAGAWFHPRFAGEPVPTLREVLELVPPDVGVNIEVKTDGEPRKRIAFEEVCILIIMEKRSEERVLVSSFDHRFLERMNRLYPSIRTGALYMPVRDLRKTPSTIAKKTGARAFICSRNQLTERIVQDAHSRKMLVGTYVVNTREQLQHVMSLGVDAVVTDHPGKIRKELLKL